jgi:hypothetical protein
VPRKFEKPQIDDLPYRDLYESLDACGDAGTILAAVLLGFLGVSAYFAI